MSQAAQFRCPCNNLLAVAVDGSWWVKYRGREIRARELLAARREVCGQVTQLAQLPAPEGAPAAPRPA